MSKRSLTLWILAAVIALAASWIRLPYYAVGPGPAREVVPLIDVTGTTTFDTGRLVMTTVSFRQVTAVTALGAWIDPSRTVVGQELLYPGGETVAEERQRSLSQMDTSKIDAAVVALTAYADYPKRHGVGALIESVFTGTPADGRLFAGDVILSIDGHPVRTPDDVGAPIAAAGAGHPIRLVVEGRPNGRTTVTVTPRWEPTVKRPVIGVSTVSNFPFDLTIDSGNIGGPSAGLMWTLGIVDLLTPEDLTGGRRIAGTGAIDLTGKVYPIGAVEEKVVAAKNAGATVFLVPVENAAGARSVGGGMTIVPVRTYQEAVTYLRTGSTGGTG
jgi:Lon-like protease